MTPGLETVSRENVVILSVSLAVWGPLWFRMDNIMYLGSYKIIGIIEGLNTRFYLGTAPFFLQAALGLTRR